MKIKKFVLKKLCELKNTVLSSHVTLVSLEAMYTTQPFDLKPIWQSIDQNIQTEEILSKPHCMVWKSLWYLTFEAGQDMSIQTVTLMKLYYIQLYGNVFFEQQLFTNHTIVILL